MLISFVGCPGSGKTSVAARVFATLKEYDLSTEFVPEQARWHIAEQKIRLAAAHSDNPFDCSELALSLTDSDQLAILLSQAKAEQTMVRSAGPECIVVADSATYNTLMYISDDNFRNSLKELFAVNQYDYVFYCAPVVSRFSKDSNRIHTPDQALAANSRINELMQEFAPGVEMILLGGNILARHNDVVRYVLSGDEC